MAKRRLCLGLTGVINCTPLSALSFWVSLFPGTRGYNNSTQFDSNNALFYFCYRVFLDYFCRQNKYAMHEVVKEKEIHASFTVAPLPAKVTATLCGKCWGKMEKALHLYNEIFWETDYTHIAFIPVVVAVVVQSLSSVPLFATPWTAACQTHLSSTISQSLLKLVSIESVILSNHLILCRPLLHLPSIIPSIRVFSKSPLCIWWPKY